jgi:hypothetical protein
MTCYREKITMTDAHLMDALTMLVIIGAVWVAGWLGFRHGFHQGVIAGRTHAYKIHRLWRQATVQESPSDPVD